jgi:predicted acetyltransferase
MRHPEIVMSSVRIMNWYVNKMVQLVKPSLEYLSGYKAALEKDWSPDNLRAKEAAIEQLGAIQKDAADFVDSLDRVTGQNGTLDVSGLGKITLPDGSIVERLPGFSRWMWDGEFCGAIGFRWQPGTSQLPPTCLGHIGYSVVPWKRRHGYATQALGAFLKTINVYGLEYILITTEPDNMASQKVILKNGGVLVETFQPPALFNTGTKNCYRIML